MINRVRCRDWIDTEKAIWIISQEYNALLHIEKDTKIAYAQVLFEKYPLCESGWYYASGVLCGDYLVCIPSAAKDIAIYSLKDRSMHYIPVLDSDRVCREIYNPTFKFCRGYAYDDNVLIFGTSYPALINLNFKAKKMDYLCDWVMEAEKYIPQGDDRFYFGDGYVRSDRKLFIPMNCCSAFLSVELGTLHCRLVFPPDKMDGIEGVTQAEDRLCFIGRKEKSYYLCLWQPGNGGMRKLQIPCQGENPGWISFLSPVFWRSKVYLAPQTADHFYVVDLESGEICIEKNLDMMVSEFPREMQDVKVGALKQNGNIVVFQTWWDYKWHKYNLDSWEHEDFEVRFDDENYRRRYHRELCYKLIDEKSVISEKTIPLPVFLDVIKNIERPYTE